MNHSIGLMIESLVAVLLVVTIGYCVLLNRRLKKLKADEHSLKAVIAELITATEIAERAIGGLKLTVRDVNENLGAELVRATEMVEQLKRHVTEGDAVVWRLSKIAVAARPTAVLDEVVPATPKLTSAKALAEAAERFTGRKRSSVAA